LGQHLDLRWQSLLQERIGNDPQKQQRDQVEHHDEVKPPQPPRLEQEHLPADDTGEHADPQGEQPPVEEEQDGDRDRQRADRLACGQALLAAHERLPDDEQAEVCEHEGPCPWVLCAAHGRQVQHHQHRDEQDAPETRGHQLRDLKEISGRHSLVRLMRLIRPGDAAGCSTRRPVEVPSLQLRTRFMLPA
jgi:hypothetical protein